MYKTRDSVEELTQLGENKENIIVLLEKLASLGWDRSHWVKYNMDSEEPFIEIYGDNSYKHIKGKSIEECYEKALVAINRLKNCEHDFDYRKDAFKICNKCGQFGKASLQEMKERFKEFSVNDENENRRYYSNKKLCSTCGAKELIQFSLAITNEKGYFCDCCKTVFEKRMKNNNKENWTLVIDPIHPDFHLAIPYQSGRFATDLTVMTTLGLESEESLKRSIGMGYEILTKYIETVEKVINPDFVATDDYKNKFLKKYVLKGKFNLSKDGKQYKVLDINYVFENEEIKEYQMKLQKNEKKQKTNQEVLGGFLESIIKGIEKEKEEL